MTDSMRKPCCSINLIQKGQLLSCSTHSSIVYLCGTESQFQVMFPSIQWVACCKLLNTKRCRCCRKEMRMCIRNFGESVWCEAIRGEESVPPLVARRHQVNSRSVQNQNTSGGRGEKPIKSLPVVGFCACK